MALLAHNWQPHAIQFTFRVEPHVAPVLFTQRVKGRLQHALRQGPAGEFPLPPGKLAGSVLSGELAVPPRDLASREAEFRPLPGKPAGSPPHRAPDKPAGSQAQSLPTAAGSAVRFSRKVGMRAIGENISEVVIGYVREQLAHVDLADARYRATLAEQAIEDANVNLAAPSEANSGRYWYNLHLIMVLAGRFRLGREEGLLRLRPAAQATASQENCAIKVLAIMPDHIHIALRGNIERSPVAIGVAFQNALAAAAGCWLFQDRFYVSSFGEYGLAAVTG